VAIEGLNRAACVVVAVHLHEAKPTGLSGEAIPDQGDIGRGHSDLIEPVADIFFRCLERQIAHIQFFHLSYSLHRGPPRRDVYG
jgi:hypothetical protein